MSIITLFGFIAFITTLIGLFPQIVKAVHTRSTKDLSLLMLMNYLICSLAWVIYGIYTRENYVILSNVLGLMSNVVLIILKYHYDKVN
ncbi:MAG: hypothetical protein A3E83_07210 [Gammaproteobacteria bacterium RIFCSPHIGHO2_12_FULL_41_20]|nr:MAG: hypothetical protein A3E83_07210 [Gammaproteobacteria bacterium RIFCSPHIGHO2_12_FULL_41_20]